VIKEKYINLIIFYPFLKVSNLLEIAYLAAAKYFLNLLAIISKLFYAQYTTKSRDFLQIFHYLSLNLPVNDKMNSTN
jgi:hypothetical protein